MKPHRTPKTTTNCTMPDLRTLIYTIGNFEFDPGGRPIYDTQHRLPSSASPPGSVPSLLMPSTYAVYVSMSTRERAVPKHSRSMSSLVAFGLLLCWECFAPALWIQRLGGFGDHEGFLGSPGKLLADNRLPSFPGSSAVASTSRLGHKAPVVRRAYPAAGS